MLLQTIKHLAEDQGLSWGEDKDIYVMEKVVAERKAFLSRKKLTYRAELRIIDDAKEVYFTELLKESGFGLSSGDDDSSPGIGFIKESYKTGFGGREGSIEEQSRLFGKNYSYTFDFAAFRNLIEAAVRDAGYTFIWKFSL